MVTAAPHVTYDRALSSSLIVQFVFSGLGIMTNGAVLLCLIVRPSMRTQPNFLVANLSCADLLVCIAYAIWGSINLVYKMEPSIHLCMYIMAPTLFALNISLCCSVAVTHHRSNCCLLGYSSVHGVANISERWKLTAASVSVWTLTCLGGAAAFIDVGTDGAVPICIYPVALQNSYLVPYAMFICCVAGVVVLDHVRVLSLLTYALVKKPSTERPNPRIVRSTFLLLLFFCIFWAPLNYISYLYLHPGASVYQESYYVRAQWLSTLPLIHTSLIDPFVYALTERDYTDTLAGIFLAFCPFNLRWRLKWQLKRFDPMNRRKRTHPPTTEQLEPSAPCGSRQIEEPVQNDPPFSISSDVIEMKHVIANLPNDQNQNGHVNHAYHSEYI